MIAIIIVHYHVKDALFKCLKSIFATKSRKQFEVIVVDNDEKKTIQKELKKQFPKVRYIKNDNKGFGQGNNIGASSAQAEYLFFLNPDTIVSKNTIDELATYLDKHKKVGIVAPLLTDMSGTIVPLQGAKILTPLRAIFSFSFISKFFSKNPIAKEYWYLSEWDKKSTKEVESIPGAAFMIRHEIYKKIQGFDEKFFLYFEEHDLSKRVKESGWKILMIAHARVAHELGESTKKARNDVSKIFRQSRLYYFRKHFGNMSALLTEGILRFGKNSLLLFIITLLGFFLRIDNIQAAMPFIGDQGWFYLSARDMLLTGQIPLVGIPSSHPWIHQGAFWTYLLAPVLWLFQFNPVGGAYLSAIIGTIGIVAIYKLGSVMFSERLGLLAAAFFATSPLIVFSDRMPYHTSPIPLVTIGAFYVLYKWITGNRYYFPLLLVMLAVLYNFELATFLFTIVILIICGFGLFMKRPWVRDIFNKKILFLAFGGWLVIMLPMILYDIDHGFAQTLKFLAWVGYRIMVFFGYPSLEPSVSISLGTMVHFVAEKYQRLIFVYNEVVALIIFFISFLFLLLKLRTKINGIGMQLLLVVNIVLVSGLLFVKVPSDAYLPLLFPGIILMTALLFDGLFGNKVRILKFFGVVIFFSTIVLNSYFIVRTLEKEDSFARRLDVAKYIVKESVEKEYTIKGEGSGSQFESYTMNYAYLTWWLGHGPSQTYQPLVFIVSEDKGKIVVVKEEVKL